jgi:glycopeptide antibiotics resistance protein
MTVLMRIESNTVREIRMQPFFTIFYYKEKVSAFMFWQGLINILMFLPIGFLCTNLIRDKRTIWKYLMIFVGIILFSIIIETEQYFLRAGVCEFDDILTNTFGGVIGMVIGSTKDIQIIKKGKGLSNNGTD